jgi:hypothetical protein
MERQGRIGQVRCQAIGATVLAVTMAAIGPPEASAGDFEPSLYNLATANIQPAEIPSPEEFRRLRAGGADLVRVGIKMSWHSTCTPPSAEHLLGGVRPRPEGWATLDRLVRNADEGGVELLGILIGYPSPCVADRSGSQAERSPGDSWARWLRAVSARYGPGGSFWDGDPDPHPVDSWEIANEPNNRPFWSSLPGYSPSDERKGSPISGPDPDTRAEAQEFASYMCVAQALLRQGNPKVQIVSGSPTMDADRYMSWVYDAGGGTCFDVYAYHTYPKDRDGVEQMAQQLVGSLEEAQRTKARHADASKRTWITEFGYGAPGDEPIDRARLVGSPGQQASYVTKAYRELEAETGAGKLGRAFWYSHQDEDDPRTWAGRAGLFQSAARGASPKPAWSSFVAEARGSEGAGPLE